MAPHDPPSFMYVAYGAVGATVVVAACVVLAWLTIARLRSSSDRRDLIGQEFIWTLVPVLVLVGLTIAGEIPRDWARAGGGSGSGEARSGALMIK